MVKLIILLLSLTACSSKKAEPHTNDTDDLQIYFDHIYRDVQNELDPVTGWIDNHDCDGLLWNGLACSLGMPVRIDLAEHSPGELHRRPYKACYSKEGIDQGSKSTISRDMVTGYLACAIERDDLDALKRLADYGQANAWIMGEPKAMVSRVLLTGNLIGLLGRAIYNISSGSSDRTYRHTPALYLPVSEDYERHVQVQGILLQEKVSGSITEEMLKRLEEHAEESPGNPLFVAALGKFKGDQAKAINLLLSEPHCPSYARGARPDIYCLVGWLSAAKIVLEGKK